MGLCKRNKKTFSWNSLALDLTKKGISQDFQVILRLSLDLRKLKKTEKNSHEKM